jgi:uncharacterized protein
LKTRQTKHEVRVNVAPQKFELRKNSDGSRSVSGYFTKFNNLSHDLGGFRETIQPGAFTQSLKDNPDVLCYYNHNSDLILGRCSSGTLSVAEDAVGLKFSCKLPDTTAANDLIALMERGDVSECSFGFYKVEDSWDEVDGQVIRNLIECRLIEGSIVGNPAFPNTVADLRSCPASLRSRLTRSADGDCDPNVDDCDEEDGACECQCGLDGCASLSSDDNLMAGEDDEDEMDSRRALILTLARRKTI